jgi:hypothetical protein
MTRCLLDELFAMRDDEGLVCAAISRGYTFDELCEDDLDHARAS